MVMPLELPEACSLDMVDKLVRERQNGRNARLFRDLEVEWKARTQSYLDHGGSPQHVETWPAIMENAHSFQNLYSHPGGGSQAEFLDKLRKHGLDICPACGEWGGPRTLDHYLPQGRYPHFAITPANLSPMCDTCQGEKLEKTGDAASPRYFIHPYFDRFSSPQILKLTIHPPFDQPTFELAPSPILQDAEVALVRTHLRELLIPDRYITFFSNELRRLARNVRSMRDSGQDVALTLAGFRTGVGYPTPNSWQHVFYDGVLTNADFMTYLTTADLPDYL